MRARRRRRKKRRTDETHSSKKISRRAAIELVPPSSLCLSLSLALRFSLYYPLAPHFTTAPRPQGTDLHPPSSLFLHARKRTKTRGRIMAPKNADEDAAPLLSADAIRKMKVGDLRSALEGRGLDSKGLKAELTARLIAAMGGQVRERREEMEKKRLRMLNRKIAKSKSNACPFCLQSFAHPSLSSPRNQTELIPSTTGRRRPRIWRRSGRERRCGGGEKQQQ